MGHFGPHFPRIFDPSANRFNYRHWGQVARGLHFPEALTDDVIPPVGPTGAGAFELVLEKGATMTLSWMTGTHKAFNGIEKRSSIVADPAARFEGDALMIESSTRAARGRLARYAAQGSAFLLGMPWEAVPIVIDSPAYTVFVPQTAALDWCVPGQPAIVHDETHGSIVVTVQSKTPTSITVDVPDGTPLGVRGNVGAIIMPAIAIYLDAQQGFSRYQTKRERWQLKGRNANAGFQQAALVAKFELGTPAGQTALLTGLRVEAKVAGAAGNIGFEMSDDAPTAAITISEITGLYSHIHFKSGATTVQNFVDFWATNPSTMLRLAGTPAGAGATTLASGDDLPGVLLAGGSDQFVAPAGLTATLTTFRGRAIWDKRLDVEGTVADSMQSMNEPQDLGGLPFTAQTADRADWGRGIAMRRPLGADFQWLKKFLYTVKGSFKSFWLPTWRKDLVPTAVGVGTLTISSIDGDFFAWYPADHDTLMVRLASGVIVYVRIAGAVDNLDGTITLSVVNELDAPVSLASVPTLVSWMEVCHLDSDQVQVRFDTWSFSFAQTARVVRS